MAPHFHQFWGSHSDAVSQLLVREVIVPEQVEVLPGNRQAMGHRQPSEGEPERMRFAGRADSIGRTYWDDSERSSRRKANEVEQTGS
jgi:hypothetical protein